MTSPSPAALATHARTWLKSSAVPLWLERGFDPRRGFFHEALRGDLSPIEGPVRTMVQARQIFSFRLALDLDLCAEEKALRAITDGTRFLLDHCHNADGSYAFSVTPGLGIARATPELYTQAFALFGLANAFARAPRAEYRLRALELVHYLNQHRAGPKGGFTELSSNGEPIYRSNPLMHLLEAALQWVEIDPTEVTWRTLADQLIALAREKLTDRATGLIAEEFDPHWSPLREDGLFYWEPGHQYEWAWLLNRASWNFDRAHADHLYLRATEIGVFDGRAINRVWSDGTAPDRAARFWPQAERAKAATQRGDTRAAAEALSALTLYLDHPRPGLWCDVIDNEGQRDDRPSKASSLYHIIGAMAEYLGSTPPPRSARG